MGRDPFALRLSTLCDRHFLGSRSAERMIVARPAMLPLSHVIQRRLLATSVAAALFLVPMTAAAASPADVDALWNQPQGVSVDSAFYVIQAWWDGLTRTTQSDPTQRGLDELAQANANLLNAYTLLQQQRNDPGPHPVAVIDPFLAGVYNFITGSDVKAPVGSLLNWANQSLLKLEGRGSSADIVRSLMTDYQAHQAAADRDLHQQAGVDTDRLWTANANRESAVLLKIKVLASPGDGLGSVLAEADKSTTAPAAKHQGGAGHGTGQATGGAGNGQTGNQQSGGEGQQH